MSHPESPLPASSGEGVNRGTQTASESRVGERGGLPGDVVGGNTPFVRQACRLSVGGEVRVVREAAPHDEPHSIHEIAGALLRPYQVREGHVALAGCTLEERPTLRLDFVAGEGAAGDCRVAGGDGYRSAYFGPDGGAFELAALERLGLQRVEPVETRLRRSDEASIDRWIAAVWQSERETLVDVWVLWNTWAAGKILVQFDAGESTTIPFAGWARDFALGRQVPPPLRCEESGCESYQVVRLEDGTITVAEALSRCGKSGREVLRNRLVRCEVSGLQIAPEEAERCAVSGRTADRSFLEACACCGRMVVPGVLQGGMCDACRDLGLLSASDVEQIEGHFGEVRQWLGKPSGWRGWSRDGLAVVQAQTLTGLRRCVLDLGESRVIRRGQRGRWSRQWRWQLG